MKTNSIQDEIDTTQLSEVDELPEIEQPQLRRSPRGHQPGRWQSNRNNRAAGCCIPYDLSYTDNAYAFNMTVIEGISKLGEIAVVSIMTVPHLQIVQLVYSLLQQ